MNARASYAAVLTPPGRGGIAVLSLGGPGADEILKHVFAGRSQNVQSGVDAAALHGMQLGTIVRGGEVLDQAVLCRTGQGFEINIHGGPAVARAVLGLFADRGAQVLPADQAPPALPTAHPKWNNPAIGREMLSAVLDARSTRVLATISNQWSVGLSQLACEAIATLGGPVEKQHGHLAHALGWHGRPAHASKISELHVRDGHATPEAVSGQCRSAAARFACIQKLLCPPNVVLAGAPNVGKSTLINALTGRTVSIVHHQSGTTRDWVREIALLRDLPVYLTDTAGLWQGAVESIDREAIDRARQCAAAADLVLLLDETPPQVPQWLAARTVLCVRTKRDLLTGTGKQAAKSECGGAGAISISAYAGEGLDELADAILACLGLHDLDPRAPAAFTQRQAELLTRAADALDACETASGSCAMQALSELMGRPFK